MDLEQEIGPDRIAYCMGKILELPEEKISKGRREANRYLPCKNQLI